MPTNAARRRRRPPRSAAQGPRRRCRHAVIAVFALRNKNLAATRRRPRSCSGHESQAFCGRGGARVFSGGPRARISHSTLLGSEAHTEMDHLLLPLTLGATCDVECPVTASQLIPCMHSPAARSAATNPLWPVRMDQPVRMEQVRSM